MVIREYTLKTERPLGSQMSLVTFQTLFGPQVLHTLPGFLGLSWWHVVQYNYGYDSTVAGAQENNPWWVCWVSPMWSGTKSPCLGHHQGEDTHFAEEWETR